MTERAPGWDGGLSGSWSVDLRPTDLGLSSPILPSMSASSNSESPAVNFLVPTQRARYDTT